MISYVLPTRDRPDLLARTLRGIGALPAASHEAFGGGEVIVVDNASSAPPACPVTLANGLPVDVVHLCRNEGAAGRNAGVRRARGAWIVMLDDDSHPLDDGHFEALRSAPPGVAAVGAEIFLPSGAREAGGLPEVFIGCGVAVRRDAFLDAGGYDPSLHFYAEEYDLAAKLLRAGGRIVHDRRFRVLHRKAARGRDMDLILRRLVRNNAWIMQRYAPDRARRARIRETIARYGRIAMRERAEAGYALGVLELVAGLRRQPRAPMPPSLFDRFTGIAAAREHLAKQPRLSRGARVAVVDAGKHDWAVRQALEELGCALVKDERRADALVVGTLSPGPMLDAWERRTALGQRIVMPWAPIARAAVGVAAAA